MGEKKKKISLMLAACLSFSMFNQSILGATDVEHIVISQIYGGGGNSGAAYTHDFIELYKYIFKIVY